MRRGLGMHGHVMARWDGAGACVRGSKAARHAPKPLGQTARRSTLHAVDPQVATDERAMHSHARQPPVRWTRTAVSDFLSRPRPWLAHLLQ